VLLFFQLLLLAGYFYAHLLIRYVQPRRQFLIHAALLAVGLATLPIIPAQHWKPTGGDEPTWGILLVLGATVGLPYTLLSATGPLLQAWYVRTHTGAIPYRLFALSNFGSMLALLSYPALVEPNLALRGQAWLWSAGFGAFALLCAYAGWKSRESPAAYSAEAARPTEASLNVDRPSLGKCLLWIGLAACASSLLLAVTSHLTQNVAPIPLLWVVPLSLYLLSFILCFENGWIYQRWFWLVLFAGALVMFGWGMYMYEENTDVIKRLIPALCVALFVCCMVCHGELARSKPHPRYLTEFYLMVSIGGAVGGLFVALASPRLFRGYWELPVALIVAAFLVVVVLWDVKFTELPRWPWVVWLILLTGAYAWTRRYMDPAWRWRLLAVPAAILIVLILWKPIDELGAWPLRVTTLAGCGMLASYLYASEAKTYRYYQFTARNFYGVLHVRDIPANDDYPGERSLIHGTINHGTQVNLPGSERIATSYFGFNSGINIALRSLHSRGPLHIGILGLGAGVTATLAEARDTLHYYEINPLVVDIAKTYFGFWNGCPADKRLYMGDGRLSLERIATSENLDFLAMDAFTSDAVPVHLLTTQAYAVYLRHLRHDGILAVNISNRYLNLAPVMAQAASEMGFTGVVVADDGDTESYYTASTWVLMSADPAVFTHANFKGSEPLTRKPGFRVWTDDYSNIIQILKTAKN
jgi:hypothetical protein